MIDPKDIPLKAQDGTTRTYRIGKYPAIAGREIVTKYPVANLPKIGDYQQSEETMIKLMAYVARVTDDGQVIQLTTKALIENHVPDWEVLARLEYASLEYNCSFFGKGLNSASFESISRKAVEWITKTLMASSGQSSPTAKPPSTS